METCPICGDELLELEIHGFAEHVCGFNNGFNCSDCEKWIYGEEAARNLDGTCEECKALMEVL